MFRTRLSLLAAILIATVSSGVPLTANAQEVVRVETDRAEILKLPVPATTVIVGNPMVADAAVFDINTLILTGKSYGATNLVVLDNDSNVVAEYVLQVAASSNGTVVMYRGNQRQTLSCAPNCERTITVGDQAESFDVLRNQTQQRIDMSVSQSGASQ
ncbi:MAG: pilus assembly protein N-terminal domain-containing protein [Pseudomonadota bacterium]